MCTFLSPLDPLLSRRTSSDAIAHGYSYLPYPDLHLNVLDPSPCSGLTDMALPGTIQRYLKGGYYPGDPEGKATLKLMRSMLNHLDLSMLHLVSLNRTIIMNSSYRKNRTGQVSSYMQRRRGQTNLCIFHP